MANMKAMKPIILYGAQKKFNQSKIQKCQKKKKKSISCITHYIEKTNFKIDVSK